MNAALTRWAQIIFIVSLCLIVAEPTLELLSTTPDYSGGNSVAGLGLFIILTLGQLALFVGTIVVLWMTLSAYRNEGLTKTVRYGLIYLLLPVTLITVGSFLAFAGIHPPPTFAGSLLGAVKSFGLSIWAIACTQHIGTCFVNGF